MQRNEKLQYDSACILGQQGAKGQQLVTPQGLRNILLSDGNICPTSIQYFIQKHPLGVDFFTNKISITLEKLV